MQRQSYGHKLPVRDSVKAAEATDGLLRCGAADAISRTTWVHVRASMSRRLVSDRICTSTRLCECYLGKRSADSMLLTMTTWLPLLRRRKKMRMLGVAEMLRD